MDVALLADCFKNGERATKILNKIGEQQYDVESWNALIKEASTINVDEVEPFYEKLVEVFPTCGRYWKIYIEHELRYKKYEKVTELFKRSLEEVIHVDLYKCYLNFIKESKPNEAELIYKAYRFTLDKVGMDPNSLSIWTDYIQFLEERETESSSYLVGQKITALRKAYHEGIVNPVFFIENLWKDYLNFEKETNPNLAEKLTQDRSRDHMNTRRVAKEWEVTIKGLNKSWPAIPPSFSVEETRQLEIWRKYIAWEKTNPLATENVMIVFARVSFAYKQFLLCFGHHPHVWHEYAFYIEAQIKLLNDKGDIDISKKLQKEEIALYDRALKRFMRTNLLIHFSYADFLETINDKDKPLEIYDNLIELGQHNDKINLTLVYIQKMRFVRRTKGIKAARAVFQNAMKDVKCGHQMYAATALMEYHCAKDIVISCKIFERGLTRFSSSCDYILSYVDFIHNLNIETNTHVLFERFLTGNTSLSKEETMAIWNYYLQFETGIGDLSNINKIEKRRFAALQECLPKCTDTSWFIDKYKFQDLFPCSADELISLNYDPKQSLIDAPGVSRVLEEINRNNVQPTKFIPCSASASNTTGEYCLPDLQQMLPFKPAVNPTFGHSVPGGIFPPPAIIVNLLSRLPPPRSFWGPFVNIDELINALRGIDFDAIRQSQPASTAASNNPQQNQRRAKKPRIE